MVAGRKRIARHASKRIFLLFVCVCCNRRSCIVKTGFDRLTSIANGVVALFASSSCAERRRHLHFAPPRAAISRRRRVLRNEERLLYYGAAARTYMWLG